MARQSSTASSHARGMGLPTRLFLIVLIACWAFVLASLVGYSPADPPSHTVWPGNSPVANWCGPFGALTAHTLFKLLGFGAWVLVVFTGLGLISAATGLGLRHALVRLVGLVLLAGCVAGLQHLVLPGSGSMPDLAGGLLGTFAAGELALRFGGLGAGIILMMGALIGALVAMDEWLVAIFGWMWEKARDHGVPAAKVAGVAMGGATLAAGGIAGKAAGRAGAGLFSAFVGMLRGKKKPSGKVRLTDLDGVKPVLKGNKRGKKMEGDAVELEELELDPILPGEEDRGVDAPVSKAEPKPGKLRKGRKNPLNLRDNTEEEDTEQEREPVDAGATGPGGEEAGEEDDAPSAPQVYSEDQLREKIAKLPIVFGSKSKNVATDADLANLQLQEEGESYRFPAMEMLEAPEENFGEVLEETVKEQAGALINALQQFKIDGHVDSIESGPVITLFHVRLTPGTKVSQLEAVSKDIARVLKAQNIRIVSNMAGRDTVGIEVPNLHKEKVRLKELMGKTEAFGAMKLPMFLGKDASGSPLIEDLTKMPHMLIAGTTGSGKSVCMNTIIMGFLYTKKPSELKLVLVDPKMVEMSQFKDIPHLMCPVVTEMAKAAAILEWATVKMDERYELLAEAGCRDIAGYNELSWDELRDRMGVKTPEEEARIPRKLPYMVFIIDELADLMMTNKDVESHIIRIAQKARAVGLHLILATQRPQANVVTGLIKSNMPCRVAFKVASGMDSRIVLDQKGAELLLGHGDMLFLSPRSSKLTRAQGTLVDDREVRKVVKFMKEVAAPSFERSLVQLRGSTGSDEQRLEDSKNNSSASLAAAQEDPMFNRAVEIVLETKRGSVSLLQRRLAIGYTRASRLVDLMGIAGIISDHKGSVARDVLISLEDWQAMQKLIEDEAKAKGVTLRHEREGGAGAAASQPDDAEQNELFDEAPPADDEPEFVPEEDDVGETSWDREDEDGESAPKR